MVTTYQMIQMMGSAAIMKQSLLTENKESILKAARVSLDPWQWPYTSNRYLVRAITSETTEFSLNPEYRVKLDFIEI